MKKYKNYRLLALLITIIGLSGCSSFGKGVASAFLDKQEAEDVRQCKISSAGFNGIEQSLVKNNGGKTKVIMIHGVGDHIPGYSTKLMEKLAASLNLSMIEREYKELTVADGEYPEKDLGILRLNRLLSKDQSRELLFYELTWSSISRPEKEVLGYDNSGEYSFRRALINDKLKAFTNDAIADPLIYLGDKRLDIQKSVNGAFCQMTAHGWDDFPDGTHEPCDLLRPELVENINKDDYIFITHSLGSRVTIDAIQLMAELLTSKKTLDAIPEVAKIADALRNRDFNIFMLSNQLPLLQLGRKIPEITGQGDQYCISTAEKYARRLSNKTNIIAFSDPNDILSYAIPPGFEDTYLDSRLCAEVTNVNINIANVIDLFGAGEMANPLEAHVGYDGDARVIEMLSHGVGTETMSPLIKERCDWIEIVN